MSRASSISTFWAWTRTRSAGTTSPVRTTTTSPGTRLVLGTDSAPPPLRMTLAVGEESDLSECIVFSALYSCQKPTVMLTGKMSRDQSGKKGHTEDNGGDYATFDPVLDAKREGHCADEHQSECIGCDVSAQKRLMHTTHRLGQERP